MNNLPAKKESKKQKLNKNQATKSLEMYVL